MVSHDFSRGTITGLSGAARASLRQGASLQELGVHRSIVDVWRSVATPVGVEMPAMSTGDIARHLGRGVSSDARPANAALFGGEVEFGVDGIREELGPDSKTGDIQFRAYDCSCHDGSLSVGDKCGQGGTVSDVTAFSYHGGSASEPCVAAVTCRGGNRCECAEEYIPGANNWTCAYNGGFRYPKQMLCDFDDEAETCRCSILCDDGTWHEDVQAPQGHDACPESDEETSGVRYAAACWSPKFNVEGVGRGVGSRFVEEAEAGCNIYVGASEVFRGGVRIGYHLFIIHYDEHNLGTVIAGQPDDNPWSGCVPFGEIMVEDKRQSHPLPAGSLWVMGGPEACGKLALLKAEAARIRDMAVCYNPLGPNSNSVAYTLLVRSGVPADKPPVNVQGWGQLI